MMMKRKNRKMWIMIASILFVLAGIAVFFRIPSSPTIARFNKATLEAAKTAQVGGEVFTEADIAQLPLPVQRYFRYCGYLGTAKCHI